MWRLRIRLPWWTVWLEIQPVNKEPGAIAGGWR